MYNKKPLFQQSVTGEFELKNGASLVFEAPEHIVDNTETLLDEFDATIYMGARYSVWLKNELGQMEINDFQVICDGESAFVRFYSTLNNIYAQNVVSTLTARVLRGKCQIHIEATGMRNVVRFHKILFKN